MKIEIEVTESELNSLNAALRMMDHFIHDSYGVAATMCRDVQEHFFANSGFDEPTRFEIDALVRKIIGGDE